MTSRTRGNRKSHSRLAKRLLELKFLYSGVGGEPAEEVFLFPKLLAITRRFMAERVRCKDEAFVQMLLLHHIADDASIASTAP
jgi:hypothetical protein